MKAFASQRSICTALGILLLAWPAGAAAQSSPSAFTAGLRYDSHGNQTGAIAPDPDGAGPLPFSAVRNSYDSADRLIRVETGKLTSWQAESVAPASWTNFTAFRTLEISYDSRSRKIKEEVWAGGTRQGVTQYGYDTMGQLQCTAIRMNPAAFASPPASACTLGPMGSEGPDRITRNSYDPAGKLLSVQRAYGVTTANGFPATLQQNYATYEYSLNGLQRAVIDANGNRAELTYDDYGRQRRWIFPSPTAVGVANQADYEEYGYDPAGNRTSLRKRDGVTLNYQYDGLNRVTVKSVPASASGAAGYSVYFGYDLRGLQTAARFGSATGTGITNMFDGFGRPASTKSNIDGTARTITYDHDSNGNRTLLTASSGHSLTYAYDGVDRVAQVMETGSSNLVAQYVYNEKAKMESLALGSVVTTGALSSTIAYGYDGIGRLSSLTRGLAGTAYDQVLGYAYNPASQITSRTSSNDYYASNTALNVSRDYARNGLNQYTGTTSNGTPTAAFAYDANGNLISDGSTAFVYDAENRLVSASGAKNAVLSYDPLGRLWQVSGGSAGTTRFVHDGNQLLEEYDASGFRLRAYAYGPDADEPLVWYEMTGAPIRRLLHADHQGSIVAVADETGAALAINAYDPWGIPNAGNMGRFQYTGQAWMAELGMYYYKARFYSPTLGRFMQTDPVGYKDQVNLYAYGNNDPINITDPSGKAMRANGSAQLKQEFAELTYRRTGYRLTEVNGMVSVEGDRANVGEAEAGATLIRAIFSEDLIELNLTKNDPLVHWDSYFSDKVDVGDFEKLESRSPRLASALFAHFLAERTFDASNGKDPFSQEDQDRFLLAHAIGRRVEGRIMGGETRNEAETASSWIFTYVDKDGKTVSRHTLRKDEY